MKLTKVPCRMLSTLACPYKLLRENTPSTQNLGFIVAGVALGVGVSYVCCRKKSCSSAKAAAAAVGEEIEVKPGTAVRSTAASGAVKGGGAAVYESSRAVQEYLCFHFLRDLIPYDCAPKNALDFPKRCAELCKKHSGKQARLALDLGCAVGASTFELSKYYAEVVGLDFSHAFIKAAKMMQAEKKTTISIQQEGEIFVDKVVTVPSGANPQRITFTQGDACNLPEKHFGPFDAILGGNLLCRLPDPDALLNRLPSLVNPHGVVVFVSPYSWLEEYTAKDKWYGGYVKDGKPVDSASTLKSKMKALGFNLVEEQQMPFLIREHVRKYQWGCSHATVWRKSA